MPRTCHSIKKANYRAIVLIFKKIKYNKNKMHVCIYICKYCLWERKTMKESIAGQCLFLSRIDSEINSLSLPTFNQPSHCCQLSYQNKNLICVIVSCMNLQWHFYAFGVRISSYGSTQPTPQYHLLASPTTTHSTHTHSIIQLARIIWD